MIGVLCLPIDEVISNICLKCLKNNLKNPREKEKFTFNCFVAHIRTGSTGSLTNAQLASQSNDMSTIVSNSQEEMRCYLEQQHQGHQQLITCMDVVGNTVLTGSQDHTLKV